MARVAYSRGAYKTLVGRSDRRRQSGRQRYRRKDSRKLRPKLLEGVDWTGLNRTVRSYRRLISGYVAFGSVK